MGKKFDTKKLGGVLGMVIGSDQEQPSIIQPKPELKKIDNSSSQDTVKVEKTKVVTTNLPLSPDIHRKVKMYAAANDTTIVSVLTEAIELFLKKH